MNLFKQLIRIVMIVVMAGLGFVILGVAAAAFMKSRDPTVIRNAFSHDYLTLAIIAGVIGLIVAIIALVLIIRRPSEPTPPPSSHF